jgi:hypothetical protein
MPIKESRSKGARVCQGQPSKESIHKNGCFSMVSKYAVGENNFVSKILFGEKLRYFKLM